MMIKMKGKSILIGCLKYNNVYLLDIDENRIEINDQFGMVIGTAKNNNFAIADKNTQAIEHIESTINFENGATIITDDGDFYDIFRINKNALVYELIGANGVIDGKIYHSNDSVDIDVVEYDNNRHLTGDVYKLQM